MNVKRKIACLAAFLFLLPPGALAAQARLYAGADVRTGPGREYDGAYSEPGSARVEVVAEVEDNSGTVWAHIEYADAYGERYRAYVRKDSLSPYGAVQSERYRGSDAVITRDTYPYCGPGSGYASTGMILSQGTDVWIIDFENGFTLIEYPDGEHLARDYVPEGDVVDVREYESMYDGHSGYGGNDGYGGSRPTDRYYAGVQGSFRASLSPGLVYKARVYESSHLVNEYGNYSCDRAFDGDPGTDWVDGSYGFALQDYVGCVWRVRDYDRIGAYGLTIRGGMQYKGRTSWARNERPRDVTVTINGYEYRYTLRDTMDEQVLYFDRYLIPAVNGGFDLRVRVDSVYECDGGATRGYDTAINDIDLLLSDE